MFKKKISMLFASIFLIGAFIMPKNVQAATIYKGVDVFEYDNISDYQALKNDGIDVAIQKASEGMTMNDMLLSYRASMLPQYGFKVGYYHFATNNGQPIAQAQHFLSQVKNLKNDTVLWLDIENQPSWSKSSAVDFVNQFVKYLENQGYSVGIYTGLSFYYEYLAGNIPAECPLWLASYGKQPVQYPNLVSWQYSESGSLDGVIGNIDLDYFNESIFNSNDYIRAIQHDLQRVGCLASGEGNATGKLDSQTVQSIKEFRYADGLTYNGNIDSELVNALNDITRKQTIGKEWTQNGNITRYLQWYWGSTKSGIFDINTVKVAKAWQVKAKIWSQQGADGVIRTVDWNKILK